MQYKKLFVVTFIGMLILLSVLPTWAQTKPKAILLVTLASSEILTSLNNDGNAAFPSDNHNGSYNLGEDDEVNYATLNLIANTDTEIWAMDVTCFFPTDTLEIYPVDTGNTTDNPTDNQAPFQAAPAWGILGSQYTQVDSPYTPNKLRVVLSRMGQKAGLGVKGQDMTISLGTIKVRVKPQLPTFEGTAKISCSYAFVDKNGSTLGETSAGIPPLVAQLAVRAGYTISGKVTQQSFSGTQAGVGVSCQTDTSPTNNTAPIVRTDATGAFKVSGLRTFGLYRCQYFANLLGVEAATGAPDKDLEPFLAGQSYVPLLGTSYMLQPIILRGGNTSQAVGSETDVDLTDLSAVTGANFGSGVLLSTPFASGDANGDRKIDKTDLALVTSNYGTSEYVSQGHYLVAGQMAPSAVPTDSRISLSTTPATWGIPEFRQLIPGTNRDFWPAISPDGSQIAFVRAIGTGVTSRYALFLMPATGIGTPVQITPANADYDAFAPSWSSSGKQLAFVRTTLSVSGNTLTRTYGLNRGWLTLVNLDTKVIKLTLGIEVWIYPPAWYNDDCVVYGSPVTNTMEELRIQANTTGAVDEALMGAGLEDMPSIVNNHLYYRYEIDGNFTTVGSEMRFATLFPILDDFIISSYTIPLNPTLSGQYHMVVQGINMPIAYYSVDRTGEKIVVQIGDTSYSGNNWYTLQLTNGQNLSTQVPVWSPLTPLALPFAPNASWNGSYATPSDLHALRSTAMSLP